MKPHPSISPCARRRFMCATWLYQCILAGTFMASLCCAPGCETKYQDNWGKVNNGMTKQEVEALLGPPSSKYDAKEVDGEVIIPEDRWQYGDNLSTLATGALFPSQAHPRAWAISFGPSGRVSQIQAADFDN